jgi:hypothetical protein
MTRDAHNETANITLREKGTNQSEVELITGPESVRTLVNLPHRECVIQDVTANPSRRTHVGESMAPPW